MFKRKEVIQINKLRYYHSSNIKNMVRKTNPNENIKTQIDIIHTAFKIISSEIIEKALYKCKCTQQFKSRKTLLNHQKTSCQLTKKNLK